MAGKHPTGLPRSRTLQRRNLAALGLALALAPLFARAHNTNAQVEQALTELLFAEEAAEFTSYRFVSRAPARGCPTLGRLTFH
jgi:hypothetical protein